MLGSTWISSFQHRDLMVLDNALLLTYHFILISGNFYLFFFLWTQTKNNKALTVVDRKKERKRNFVNAKTGMICAFWLPVTYVLYSILYGLKVNIMLNDYQRKKKVTFDKLDSMPVNNVYNGLYHCDNNK